MLNGATTKLRNAQAISDERQDEAEQAPAAVLFGAFEAVAACARRGGEGGDIRRFFRRAGRQVKGGVAIARPPIMCLPQWPNATAITRIKRLDELFAAEPDRLSQPQLRDRRPLFRLVENPPRSAPARRIRRAGGADGLRGDARCAVFAAKSSMPARAGRRPMSPSAAMARPRTSTSPPPAASACARWSTRSRPARSAT